MGHGQHKVYVSGRRYGNNPLGGHLGPGVRWV